jgi:hypothetical protein
LGFITPGLFPPFDFHVRAPFVLSAFFSCSFSVRHVDVLAGGREGAMQALTVGMGGRGSALLEAGSWQAPLIMPRPWAGMLPMLTGCLRLGMGSAMGVLFGAVAGNAAFWIVLGLVLGGVLCSLAAGAEEPVEVLKNEGVYRIRP